MIRPAFMSALTLLAVLAAPLSAAQHTAPDVLLKGVTLEVITMMKLDKDLQAGDPAKVAELIETRILPHFDFPRMTQTAVALNWRGATSTQQTALTTEFRTLLVRTYSTALASYRDQVIEFKPLRAAAGDTEVTVKSSVRQPGAAPLAMDYEMERVAVGWKVYDIKIGGISLVTTYREMFAGTVRESGVDGLIKLLSEKNRLGDARFRSQKNIYVPVALAYATVARHFFLTGFR
jgi:phospholipid transport system substrate-binding protein